eukprot:scaffold156615_cov17-Tisochrysis_lutea.AAC.1
MTGTLSSTGHAVGPVADDTLMWGSVLHWQPLLEVWGDCGWHTGQLTASASSHVVMECKNVSWCRNATVNHGDGMQKQECEWPGHKSRPMT